ncbi:MAG: helix-turn-helix transcriptional regulator [Oscillospiraceae bacterium]|nr:helix-turn-helix transcriptional regulator [Oscillospiraceae bacterium]
MLQDAIKYLEYLENVCGLSVSIHTPTANADPVIDSMAPYNIHRSPFCLSVKESVHRHRQCLAHQQQVRKKCTEPVFCVTCPFGVGEYIVPICREEALLGYLAVSTQEREQTVRTLLRPLAAMLSLVLEPSPHGENNDLYQHILAVIHGNLDKKLTIEQVAQQCYCSASMVSHLFKSRSGTTVNRYITEQKMRKAKQLLEQGRGISETAQLCGYEDANYFISVFKRRFGLPPMRYQKSSR